MITAKKDKNGGVEVRFSGSADDIKMEMTFVLTKGLMAISEDDKEDVESNFVAMFLTVMELLKDEGVDIDIEQLKRVLDVKAKIDIDKVVEAIGMIIGAIKGEEPNGE